jgi:hypothetical protein
MIKNLLAAGLAVFALLISGLPCFAQQVYVGVADQWGDLINHGDQWQFVRQNADGFYLNFIMMEYVVKGQHGMNEAQLTKTAALFKHKNAYFESDYHLDGQNEVADDRDIDLLQQAGFVVPYTSLNDGWDVPRYQNLKTYHLRPGQKPRYSVVQDGPWTINGDLSGNVSSGGQFPNMQYRDWIDKADGDSTDGPLGFWFDNPGVGFNHMQSGSYSMVRYAHAQGKLAVVMLCPYGAGISTYDAPSDFLSTGENCIRGHEDHDAEPDVYDVFEYATSIGAVPEQKNGAPALNSTTALAYYLIKHLKGDPGTLHLSVDSETRNGIMLPHVTLPGTTLHYVLKIADTSPWLDYAAVLHATLAGTHRGWTVRYKLHGQDITSSVLGKGFEFYQGNRIEPKST